jgi:putative addiction module antidote
MQKLKIRKVGNSLGAILNSELINHLHVQEGDEVFAIQDSDGIRITPYDPTFDKVLDVFERGRREYRNTLRKLAE